MEIEYTGAAFAALTEVINFVEAKNTLGAGIRWLNRFELFLEQELRHSSLINHCNFSRATSQMHQLH